MKRSPVEIGERVYLTPRTIGAPGIAYKQPRGRVAARRGEAMVVVDLDDGSQVEIHEDDVVRRLPPPPKPAKQKPKPPMEGAEEVPLW